MNDINRERFILYRNWLQQGIELQKSGKGNILGYEDKLTSEKTLSSKVVHKIGGDYIQLCMTNFYTFIESNNKKTLRFITDLALAKRSYRDETVLVKDTEYNLSFVAQMKQGIFENNLDSLLRIFPELDE